MTNRDAGLTRVVTAILAISASNVMATWALAADEPEAEAAADGGLEEVVVTARKREESLQTVPMNVLSFSAEDMERRQVTSLENIAGNVPNLFVGRTSNAAGAVIFLRGVGSQSSSLGIWPSTAIVVDGVYYGSGFFLNEGLFDMESMQVLVGPQALFYGKNATAGVIALTTADPTSVAEGEVRVGYETTAKDVQGSLVLSGPITETLSGRIAVRASNMAEGYFTNKAVRTPITIRDIATGTTSVQSQQPDGDGMPGTSEQSARATLLWMPTDALSLKLKASATTRDDESNAWNYVIYKCPTGYTQPNPTVKCRRDFVVYVPNAPDVYGGNLPWDKPNGSPYNSYESQAYTLDFNYEFDKARLTSIGNYSWLENRWGLSQNVQSPTSFIDATQESSLEAWSNETRLEMTFNDSVNLLAGLYYQNITRRNDQSGAIAPLIDSSAPDGYQYLSYFKPSETKGDTVSVFGQVNWRIIPEVELAAGLRYTDESYDSFLVQSYVIAPLQVRFPQDRLIESKQKFDNVNPELTISYYPSEDLTIYAGYKTGYKSGGFSNSSLITSITQPDDVSFDPETASGFEVGVKSVLADRQLRLNATLYRTTYEDLQINYFNSIMFLYITTNAGEARVQGVELSGEYAPDQLPGLRLNAFVNYNDAQYTKYIGPCYTGQSIAGGCDTTFNGGLGQDLKNQPLATAPEWTASIGATYEAVVGAGRVFTFAPLVRYSSSYLGSAFGNPLSQQDAYFNVDATVSLRSEDARWEAAIIGRNLTDQFRISSENDLPNSGSGTGTDNALSADQVGLADLPRTVLFQVTHRF